MMLLAPTASLRRLQDCQKLSTEQIDVFLNSHFIDQPRSKALAPITETTSRPTAEAFGHALPVDEPAEEFAA